MGGFFSRSPATPDSEKSEDGTLSPKLETLIQSLENLAADLALEHLYKEIGTPQASLESFADINWLSPATDTFKDIQLYVENGHCPTHNFRMEILSVFQVRRHAEKMHGESEEYRMMLWHGTKKSNVTNILKFGFAKPSRNTGNLMYGTGVYFADRASKSAQYCGGTGSGTTGFMFLCDLSLGKVYKAGSPHHEYTAAPKGFDTVKACGEHRPDWKENKEYLGSILPVGKTVEDKRFSNYHVKYNEYVVYEESRVVLSFLVQIQFK